MSGRDGRPPAVKAPKPAADDDPLALYKSMRDFSLTPEPTGRPRRAKPSPIFVIQKHAARSLHYDFRLELDGTLRSWAVPKGPSLDPGSKRMAVHVEDHPLAYADFEGVIPPKQYGAGEVIVWDRGTWSPIGDARAGYRDGKLKFELHGVKLRGRWALVRMRSRAASERQDIWLLMKERDSHARTTGDVLEEQPESVLKRPWPVPASPAPASGRPEATSAAAAMAGAAAVLRGTSVAPAPRRGAAGGRGKRPAADAAPDGSVGGDPPAGAVAAGLPPRIEPQLATLVEQLPGPTADWLFEIKFDGYRVLARSEAGTMALLTRNGIDWTHRMPALAEALSAMALGDCWLDGEIVVLDARGAPDFQALQNAFERRGRSGRTRAQPATGAIQYFVFDLPFHGGWDLRQVPLEARRERLQRLLAARPHAAVRFSEAFDADPGQLLESAQRMGLEGVIGKRRQSVYRGQRTPDWIKLKARRRQEFVIGGYTPPQGSRAVLGSLMLGLYDGDGRLHYAGNVGSGFDEAGLAALRAALTPLVTAAAPFVDPPTTASVRRGGTPHWVAPQLVAEVSFQEWTRGGHVRQAVFHGLRDDKPARDVMREQPVAVGAPDDASADAPTVPAADATGDATAEAAAAPAKTARRTVSRKAAAGGDHGGGDDDGPQSKVHVTHAERVIDPSTGLTKGDLVGYYARVASLMLPHLRARPVALLRAPHGVDGGQTFFQKHAKSNDLPDVTLLDPALDPGHGPALAVLSTAALLSAAQMNTIELHTWNARTSAIERPDRMVFDLDPGEGAAWSQVQEGAQLLRSFLIELGLQSLLKTSGGKGLHVVVPLASRTHWRTVKAFSHAIVLHMAQVLPQRFVAKSGPRNRVGRIFIDYLRNGLGSTTACAWSARCRPGMGISVPVAWDELDHIGGGAHWTVATAGDRLAIGNEPWAEGCKPQGLSAAMKALGFKMPTGDADG